jgi:hypothetical protein
LPLLQRLIEERFPRIWLPSAEERDGRQLLVHQRKQVQARTRVKNQLQALALSRMVGLGVPTVIKLNDDLGLRVKSFLPEQNGAPPEVDAGVSPESA